MRPSMTNIRRPSTSTRPRTGNVPPGTASTGNHIVALPNVRIGTARPVTAGLEIKTGTASGTYKRQVQDAGYVSSILRQKIRAIQAETSRLRDETKHFEEEKAKLSKLEREKASMSQNVQDLETKLIDLNLSLDHMRNEVRVEELNAFQNEIESKNSKLANEVETLFLLTAKNEKEISRLESMTNFSFDEAQNRLRQDAPELINEFETLMTNRHELKSECERCEKEIETLRKHKFHLQNQIDRNIQTKQCKKNENQIKAVERHLHKIELELKLVQMDPTDAHEELMSTVKDAQLQTKELEKRKEDLNTQLHLLRNQLEPHNQQKSDLQENQLKTMSDFLLSYDERENKLLEERNSLQSNICSLLEKISKCVVSSREELPTIDRMARLNEEVELKEKELERTKTTFDHLKNEKEIRLREVEKIEDLGRKIDSETESIETGMNKMRVEMKKFADIPGLKDKINIEKDGLAKVINDLRPKLDETKMKVIQILSEYQRNKKLLDDSKTRQKLCKQERELQKHEQGIFDLRGKIAKKIAETDYIPLKTKCMNIVENLNEQLIEVYQ